MRGHRQIQNIYRTLRLAIFKDSDIQRWTRSENLNASWVARTKMLVQFIPENSTVIELGAGHGIPKDLLPRGCEYIATDLVARTPNTRCLDLNANSPFDLPACDIIFSSGVLEYVYDLVMLIEKLTPFCSQIVTSYAPARSRSLLEITRRREAGWVNDLLEDEFYSLFSSQGFRLVARGEWQGQILCHFRKAVAE